MIVLTAWLLLAAPAESTTTSVRWVMGSPLRVVVGEQVDPQLIDACYADAQGFDALLSTWDPASPLSVLNADADGEAEVPLELADYLERVQLDHARTGGLFDPSVLTWKNAPVATPIGMHRVEIERNAASATVRFPSANFAIDSGGDGKGVALDAMVRRLEEHGVDTALLDFGGSSWWGMAAPEDTLGWAIPLAGPAGEVVGTIQLCDRALSVSASVQRDVAEDGGVSERFHIIDPRSGRSVQVARVVAVVATSATEAEVLSTALVVAGPEGADLLDQYPGAQALWIEADGRIVGTPSCFTPASPASSPR